MSNWDEELKKIDKQLESISDSALVPAPAKGASPAAKAAVSAKREETRTISHAFLQAVLHDPLHTFLSRSYQSFIALPGDDERPQLRIAQVQATPHHHCHVSRKEDVAEQRIADAYVRGDGAAEVAGPEECTEDGGEEESLARHGTTLRHEQPFCRFGPICGVDQFGRFRRFC